MAAKIKEEIKKNAIGLNPLHDLIELNLWGHSDVDFILQAPSQVACDGTLLSSIIWSRFVV